MPPSTSSQTSFIPKRNFQQGGMVRPRVRSGINFFLLVGTILFVISIVAAGLVYAWRVSVEKQIEASIAFINKNEKGFDQALLGKISEANRRMVAGKELFDKHIAYSKIFQVFEVSTLKSVRLTSLSASINDKGDVAVNVAGMGDSKESVALQSDEFAKSKILKNPITTFSLADEGRVNFNLTATLPGTLVLYKN
ncbi:MAG: hypothetical protein NTV72_02715 [Candidatus Taylorbacteria bacterium]|nr:hypothetical protein [Candidatus Taylorbacteria bacterium]